MSGWTIRPATPADCDAAVALVARAHGRPPDDDDVERWRWLFEQHPAGGGLRYLVADAGDRLVAQYALLPVRLQHDGTVVRGLLSLDTATDPDYTRRGLFVRLAGELYERTAAEAPVVFGFPNRLSARGLYDRLGWVELRPFPGLVLPTGPPAPSSGQGRAATLGLGAAAAVARLVLAARPARGIEVAPLDRFGPWADELWERLRGRLGTCVVRDAAYLDWRFVAAPHAYRRWVARRDGRPVAFAVGAVGESRFGPLAYVMELLGDPSDGGAARALLGRLVRDAREAGAPALVAPATGRHPYRGVLRRSGFVPMPGALRSSFSFGVRVNGPGAAVERLLRPDDWYVSGADLDHV